jgi:single-strand DNA-binding protein
MANSFNKVILMGNTTRDPVVRDLPSGQKVAEIGLALNRNYTHNGEKKEEVTYVEVSFWGAQAETLQKYLKKGRPLLIEGHLKFDQWEDNGTKRSKLRVVGDSFQFIGSREGNSGGGDSQENVVSHSNSNSNSTPNRKTATVASSKNSSSSKNKDYQESYEDFDNVSDDEIPF